MSGRANVLAVWDAMASVLRGEMKRRNDRANRPKPHPEALIRQDRISYLLASHAEARAAVAELIEALRVAVRQNSHDMLMTGDELRQCTAALARAQGGGL